MKRLCVFGGSSVGSSKSFGDAVDTLGRLIAASGVELIYGGAHVGLMGRVADSVLTHGGHVIGVIPESMVASELAHSGIQDLRIVSSMHERKALMAQLADGFIAVPGGMGTLDELTEMFTWFQLGLHQKPCGILNVDRYFTPFLQFLDGAIEQGFLTPEHSAMLVVEHEPGALLARLAASSRDPVARRVEIESA